MQFTFDNVFGGHFSSRAFKKAAGPGVRMHRTCYVTPRQKPVTIEVERGNSETSKFFDHALSTAELSFFLGLFLWAEMEK